jgi:hypothetical protein
MNRSLVHTLNVAAARLKEALANPKLVADLQNAAEHMASKRAQGRGYTEDDERRIEAQRTLFNMLPDTAATDRLKHAVLQRAYDLLWDGDGAGCDALLEFMPSRDADGLLNAWCADQDGKQPRSKWYEGRT